MRKPIRILALLGCGLFLLAPAAALGQGAEGAGLKKEVAALRAEVTALKSRLSQLEAIKPTFTNFMPAFSERFHVMHLAGDAGDWQLALHEFIELERMVGIAEAIEPKKGKLMKAFLDGNLKDLKSAIDHGNHGKFRKALKETVITCNKCHEAVGSPFIQVTLDPRDGLTMRHPHALRKTKVKAGSAHKH